MNVDSQKKRCGFAVLIGAPNAGKSTLVNNILESKISIVSPKVQTTRVSIKGVFVRDNSEVIFIDTPGIFKPQKSLEKAIVDEAKIALSDADIILLMIDAKKGITSEVEHIISILEGSHRKAVLVLNKVDLVNTQKLLPLTKELNDMGLFTDTFMISAMKKDGVDKLLDFVIDSIPEGPWLYPEGQVGDSSLRFYMSEITREKVFLLMHKELPYSVAVVTDDVIEEDKGDLKVYQTIYVAKPGHKSIVLGKSGQMIKRIGQNSRRELEKELGSKVHLFLHVKVKEKWTENSNFLKELGFYSS